MFEAFVLALVQGITEWLPVSSSGHLVLFQKYINVQYPVFFDVMLHVGTLCVVIYVFRNDVLNVLKAVKEWDFKGENGKMALFILVGSIPTALIGFTFQPVFEAFFEDLFVVGVAFLVTGCFLYVSKHRKNGGKLGFLDAFLIGVSQGVSVIPGISRSGATISTGILRKVERRVVLKYSFLLSIPAVLGAAAGKLGGLTVENLEFTPLLLALVTSIIVGYFSLKLLLKAVMGRKLHYFAYYCWAAGLLTLLLLR